MRNFFRITLTSIGVVFGFSLIIFIGLALRFGSLHVERWFQPREENVRREVFEETKSYNEGMEQQLVKYRLEYMRGDEVEKAAISSAVRHAYADYNVDRLDPQLRNFVLDCRNGE